MSLLFALLPALVDVASAQDLPADYDGTYDLQCASLQLRIDTNLNYTGPLGASSYPGHWEATVACSTPVAAIEGWARGVAASCRAQGVPAGVCRDFGRELFLAVRPFADAGDVITPTQLDLAVNTWSSPLALFGVYDTTFTLGWADGGSELAYGNIQSAPATEGLFTSLDVAVGGAGQDSAVCLALTTGLLQGTIDANQGFALAATMDVGAGFQCAAVSAAGDVWSAGIGVAARLSVTGAPAAP